MKYKTLKTTDIQHDYDLLMGKINVLALVLEYVTSCHHVEVIITNN